MKTILYDTELGQPISKIFENGYKVDGKKPELPEHILELIVIKEERPHPDPFSQRVERVITISVENETYTEGWEVIDLSDYEIAMKDWEGGDLELKIIAPIQLILDDFGVKMKGWFELNGLPVIPKGEVVHLYCRTILPEFAETVDGLVNSGTIQIIERPKKSDFE